METENFEAIVIGAGQGGGPLASAFARAGKKTALIEREFPGGTCVNWGCTPTKTMIASGRVAHLARRAADYGIISGEIAIEMTQIRRRKRDIVQMFRDGSRSGIDSTEGLEYIEGDAKFTGEKSISVSLNAGGMRELSAEIIVLNVGERFRELDPGVAQSVPLYNAGTIMEIDEVPAHLLVIGGGPIALEFGQLFRRLGANVTILNRGPQILSREDPDIAEAVVQILEQDGISIERNATPISIVNVEDDVIVTISREQSATEQLQVSHVLVASGRAPNTELLGLESTGVHVDENGYIPTDERLETNVPGMYAIGDVRPGPKFTHISYDDYRVLKTNLIDGGDRTITNRLVPATTFIDPQLGRIGMSESEAKRKGIRYLVAQMPMSRVARALETDETRGVMKILVDAATERIIGAAILGIEGGEIASMLQIAMMGNLPYTALRDGVFAHPGLAEALNNVFLTLEAPTN